MCKTNDLKTGVLYRNPKPHVRSIHAYFPSVAVLPDGEMLATVAMGEAFEAVNLRTHVFRSTDGGETWQAEGPIYPGTKDRLTSDCARLTALPNGELVVFMVRHDRADHPEEGLTNHETLGFVPMELLFMRSADRGKTWTGPDPLDPPLIGPAFELCCPITVLKDGQWLIPTATWPGWNGECPNGIKMIALLSYDQGVSWPEYVDVMSEPGGRVFFWETKIIELPDERLLATAWAYDNNAKTDRPNQFVLSGDGGRRWSAPCSTGLQGQTLTPMVLDDGRLLCIYRRMDQPGLWANISRLDDNRWVNLEQIPLWGYEATGLTATTDNMTHNFNVLRFGAPCLARLADGTIFVAFWCYEDCVSVIRWFKMTIGG